jgi:hypothetical protein
MKILLKGGDKVKMNKKLLGFALAFIFLAMLATPLVCAKPATEKNNDKFEYFDLIATGLPDENPDKSWTTPPNADESENKTEHSRGGGWITWPSPELTVGDETFDWESAPYSIDWTTTVDSNALRFNNGTAKHSILKLTDVVTVYYEGVEIGTLVLELKSSIRAGAYSGNIMGYGTGALKGVHISAIDLGVVGFDPTTTPMPTVLFERVGTITGWPEQITKD